jgi:hypothetical protein
MKTAFLPSLLFAACLTAISASAQTVYIPSGTSGIGSSSNGNVGIGISNPNAKLQVVGDLYVSQTSGSDLIRAFGLTTGFTFTDQTTYIYLRPYHAANGDKPLQIGPGAGGIRIDTTGFVGIGLTSPQHALDVKGGSAVAARLTGTNGTQLRFAEPVAGEVFAIGSDISAGQATAGNAGFEIYDLAHSASRLSISASGNVGLGTVTPAAKLEVKAGASGYPAVSGTAQPNASLRLGNTQTNGVLDMGVGGGSTVGAWLQYTNLADLSQTYPLLINPNGGNVGIGTTNPTHKLSVNGTIRTKEVIVDTAWSDYVFDADYRLAPLSEVEAHIKAEKHLPGIPSATEVAAHGVSMGEMQSKLLAKIEELTLHQIAQEKTLGALRQQNERLQQRISQLESR